MTATAGSLAGKATDSPRGKRARGPARFFWSSDDLAHGQTVIITARWVLIACGLITALWNPAPVTELRTQIIAISLLATINFFLHAQLIIGQPALDRVVYAASIADLTVITAIILSQDGFASPNYIFYYPAILAFSVSFPRAATAVFTFSAVATYGLVSLGSASTDETELFVRLLTMVGVATCGSLYWDIERYRQAGAPTGAGGASGY
jgi:hypothetical protein